MKNRKVVVAAALACVSVSALLLCACDQNSNAKDPIVRVGKVVIGKEAFEAFQKVTRIYPAPPPPHFPNMRQPATFMAECEAIYQHSKQPAALVDSITSTLDWAWKKKYFTAALFFDLMGDNLGFTDAELESLYRKNPEAFRVTAKNAAGEDSSYIPPFEAAKRQAADELFYEKYKPDSAFLARIEENKHEHDHEHDEATIRNHWIYNARSNPADFYMRRIFFEKTGEVYRDSIEQIYGEGKPIASDDIDVIRSWVPSTHRSMRMKELIEWLYKWKVFAERAEKLGLASKPVYKDMLYWALRMEYAGVYLQNTVRPLLPAAGSASDADVGLAELTVYDQARRVEKPNMQMLQTELNNIAKIRTGAVIDSVIYEIRKSVGITWMQDEFKDERSADPATLIAKADSLKEAAAESDDNSVLEEAEKIYRMLTGDFVFTSEGRRAMGEMAKILTDKYNASSHQERHLLISAIGFYRRAQIYDPADRENMCNSFFMVGFTYDEHLKNYALAEANYKWVLRNAPDCALASDAEFMLLHLDEPMTSIEEIQGQSQRQGRVVDFDDDAAQDEGGSPPGA